MAVSYEECMRQLMYAEHHPQLPRLAAIVAADIAANLARSQNSDPACEREPNTFTDALRDKIKAWFIATGREGDVALFMEANQDLITTLADKVDASVAENSQKSIPRLTQYHNIIDALVILDDTGRVQKKENLNLLCRIQDIIIQLADDNKDQVTQIFHPQIFQQEKKKRTKKGMEG